MASSEDEKECSSSVRRVCELLIPGVFLWRQVLEGALLLKQTKGLQYHFRLFHVLVDSNDVAYLQWISPRKSLSETRIALWNISTIVAHNAAIEMHSPTAERRMSSAPVDDEEFCEDQSVDSGKQQLADMASDCGQQSLSRSVSLSALLSREPKRVRTKEGVYFNSLDLCALTVYYLKRRLTASSTSSLFAAKRKAECSLTVVFKSPLFAALWRHSLLSLVAVSKKDARAVWLREERLLSIETRRRKHNLRKLGTQIRGKEPKMQMHRPKSYCETASESHGDTSSRRQQSAVTTTTATTECAMETPRHPLPVTPLATDLPLATATSSTSLISIATVAEDSECEFQYKRFESQNAASVNSTTATTTTMPRLALDDSMRMHPKYRVDVDAIEWQRKFVSGTDIFAQSVPHLDVRSLADAISIPADICAAIASAQLISEPPMTDSTAASISVRPVAKAKPSDCSVRGSVPVHSSVIAKKTVTLLKKSAKRPLTASQQLNAKLRANSLIGNLRLVGAMRVLMVATSSWTSSSSGKKHTPEYAMAKDKSVRQKYDKLLSTALTAKTQRLIAAKSTYANVLEPMFEQLHVALFERCDKILNQLCKAYGAKQKRMRKELKKRRPKRTRSGHLFVVGSMSDQSLVSIAEESGSDSDDDSSEMKKMDTKSDDCQRDTTTVFVSDESVLEETKSDVTKRSSADSISSKSVRKSKSSSPSAKRVDVYKLIADLNNTYLVIEEHLTALSLLIKIMTKNSSAF